MRKQLLYWLIVFMEFIMSSCYTRELYYSFEPSSGGVTVGSSYYYLAQVREYRMPEGISRFPDGGISKEVRQVFGFFRTDSVEDKTYLVSRLDEICCWPSWYATRIERNESVIVFGIMNVCEHDSLEGIYIYDLENKTLRKFSKAKGLPAISNFTNRVAYCVDNKLCIDDIDGTPLFSYILNAKPVFVSWNNDDEIFVFLSNPNRVQTIKLSTGKTTDTDFKYLSNHGQEKFKSNILKVFKDTNPDLKQLLDNFIPKKP
ncbi:MAG: hypothetical protein AB7S48_06380 [Bacteroidales bacterium]